MKKTDCRRPRYFFRPLWLLAAVLGIQSAQAQFTIQFYEPFSEYTEGERLRGASSASTWTIGNTLSSTTSPIISTNYALNYPGLLPDPNVPARGILGATGAGRTHGAPFTALTSGTNYLSFLLSVSNLPAADRPIIGLNAANSGTPSPNSGPSVWITPAGQLKLDKGSSAAAQTNVTPALTVGSTYLVVMAYKYPGTGEVDLWLNPAALGNNANVPAPTISITNGTSPTTLQSLCLYSGTGIAISTNLFDEIRVTTNWANATPASPSPGNVYNVTGGGAGCPGDVFPVGLSGSDLNISYLLYTNGSYSGVISAGTGGVISFGPQSVTGIYTVLATNTVNSNVGWMNGSLNVSVLAGPSITTQPTAVVVATNGLANFTVVATGDALHYQWFRNGAGLSDGGHVSGSATTSLTISPATTADAATTVAGYYVIITNSCSLIATSTTNALTLQPPASLVWQGGNPNTNWDLATTANWTNSSGTPVKFNAGDNVTFDDSSTNQLVTIVGNVTPSSITENSTLAYALIGSGSISGAGKLVMNGSGTLTISNANSFSGGTTINSGTVALKDSSQLGLGLGTVTLAGGTLEVGLKSGVATVGLTNLNATASSTLQFDGAGSFALNVLGTLTGSPSATITVYDNLDTSVTADRVRLYGAFTNNAPIVISSRGNTVEMAPYNASGNQVYNGIISGSGGRIVPRAAGYVIFNAANTFNDNGGGTFATGSGNSVLLSGGNVGVGIDSVSSSPPTIDAGPLGTGNLAISVGEGGTSSLFASGGAHKLGNRVLYTSATNTYTLVFGGTNNLTLTGEFSLSTASDASGTNRTLQVTNQALTILSGVIDDGGLGSGIIKSGNGTLVLNGSSTYTGSTVVSNGLAEGTGTLVSAVTIAPSGTLGAGTTAIGTFTINSNLTIAGNTLFKVNKSLAPAQSNDLVSVSGTLSNTGTGTVTVSNLGPALVVGDRFKLFSQAVANGLALTITGGGMNWTNKLAVDGSIQALSVASTLANYSTNITASVSGSTLTIGWPATHLGWILQSQTNSLNTGLTAPTNTWFDVSGSAAVTQQVLSINPANPTVFLRLRHP